MRQAHPRWWDDVQLVAEGFAILLVLLAVVIVASLV